jgi:hypothetical protein
MAASLAGAAVQAVERVGGGRNSRVFRVDTTAGRFALKQYPARADDPRDRLGTEMAALRWMEAQAFDAVPRFVAADRACNVALLSWVEGTPIREVGQADIDQVLVFLGRLQTARGQAETPPAHLAAEACLSGAEIERQIRHRAVGLGAIAGEPALRAFLDEEFAPCFERRLAAAKAAMASSGLDFDRTLPQCRRGLVPSDLGFHNALRDAEGRLIFIDFEYFGWDDPVKLTADILLHPGTPVPEALRRRLRRGAEVLYGREDPDLVGRLETFLPLFRLRWTLILLNEFHPERWRRRVLAGAAEDWPAAKRRQLAKARAMLAAPAHS